MEGQSSLAPGLDIFSASVYGYYPYARGATASTTNELESPKLNVSRDSNMVPGTEWRATRQNLEVP